MALPSAAGYNRMTRLKGERSHGMDGEWIDTAGRVERMGAPFADKYGTDYALTDEVANKAIYALGFPR